MIGSSFNSPVMFSFLSASSSYSPSPYSGSPISACMSPSRRSYSPSSYCSSYDSPYSEIEEEPDYSYKERMHFEDNLACEPAIKIRGRSHSLSSDSAQSQKRNRSLSCSPTLIYKVSHIINYDNEFPPL